jgi:sporulation protein YlmC with PRC-barrel domain
MLRSVKNLKGYTVLATEGEIGRVQDFYFDAQAWTIRYLVVDTGDRLSNRLIFLAPTALHQSDWEAQILPVSLTQDQIKNSPHINPDKPMSRQQESELRTYYDWPPYWDPATLLPTGATTCLAPLAPIPPVPPSSAEAEALEQTLVEEALDDPNLYSANEVRGYSIQARDNDMGHINDFLADDETWAIQYLIVNTGNWLPGKKVRIAASWAKTISWTERIVTVDLQRETIENSPEYETE